MQSHCRRAQKTIERGITVKAQLDRIEQQIAAISIQLEKLLVPAARQEASQIANLTNEERKARNKEVLKEAKLMVGGKR